MRLVLRTLGRLVPLAALAALATVGALSACNTYASDADADAGTPSALGSGDRVRDVMNPGSPSYPNNGATVAITGATFLLVDAYDETHDGKSIGTVYMQDVPPSGVAPPFSGVALYKPTYVPTNLLPAPGDILDLTGTFSVSTSLGAANFTETCAWCSLTQIDDPILEPRFEYQLPAPVVLQPSALIEEQGTTPVQSLYNSAQQWVGMLVTIPNVTLTGPLVVASTGRATALISSDTNEDGPALDNELFDVATWNSSFSTPPLQTGAKLTITGIVTWFYDYHIAPRSPADIVVAP